MKTCSRSLVVISVLGVLAFFGYRKLNESQRRFLGELARQVPYLVPRYFA